MRVGGSGRHGGGELQCRQRLRQLHSAERLVWELVLVLRIVRKMLGQYRGYLLQQLEEVLPRTTAAASTHGGLGVRSGG